MPRPRDPRLAEILQATIETSHARIHKSLPARVVSYDVATQHCSAQILVQIDGETISPLQDVPVCWPGGAAGFLHVPLEAGDNVLLVFCDEDYSKWWETGSISPPLVQQRHGLHPIAIPGLRRAAEALDVTGGHVTLSTSSELRLGSDNASDPVALKSLVESAVLDLLDGIISSAGSVTPLGGGPAFVAALQAFKTTYQLALQVGAEKVKAE
jgi:protein gp138